jgi:hypothetical protein
MPPEAAWPNEEPFSDHPRGVNCILADGSAMYLDESTDRRALVRLASRDGNEPRSFKD